MRILIAGGGQSAALVAARLIREGNQLVLVEENPERCLQLEEMLDAKIVRGNAASVGPTEHYGHLPPSRSGCPVAVCWQDGWSSIRFW